MTLAWKNVPTSAEGDRFINAARAALTSVFWDRAPREKIAGDLAMNVEALKSHMRAYPYHTAQAQFHPDDGSEGRGRVTGSITAAPDVVSWLNSPMTAEFSLEVRDGKLEKWGI